MPHLMVFTLRLLPSSAGFTMSELATFFRPLLFLTLELIRYILRAPIRKTGLHKYPILTRPLVQPCQQGHLTVCFDIIPAYRLRTNT